MFTINFKGKPNPKNKKLVKLEMVFFRTDYPRAIKVLNVLGLYKDWDQNTQCFKSKDPDYLEKNEYLLELRKKYHKVAIGWDRTEYNWTPVQLSRYFETQKLQRSEVKVLNVMQMIDLLIEKFSKQERFKNGKLVIGSLNAREYHFLKRSLSDFTKQKYRKALSTYFFTDIDEDFVINYSLFLQIKGAKNRNKGALSNRLKKLQAVFNHANKMDIPDTDTKIFRSVENKMKQTKFEPKTIPFEIIQKIESIDRSKFTKVENTHIDIFLFCFYAGGMANIDAAHLIYNCIIDNMIVYERMKFPKEARVPLINKAKAIIVKYKNSCYADYVLPIFTHKHNNEKLQRARLEYYNYKLNLTLEKVRKAIRYKEKITWYSSRGSYITKMINDGYHPILVAEHAGNSPEMIYKHYYKTTNKDEILKKMNKSF
ncbi:MAG: phage integrase SAM-like domain-containing protein [Dysgonomonas sp.]